MFGKFSEETQKVINSAKKEMCELNHPYVGTEHLLLAILNKESTLSKMLKNYNLSYKNFKEELVKSVGIGKIKSNWFLFTPMLKKVLESSLVYAKENNTNITTEILLLNLLKLNDGIAVKLLDILKIDKEKIIKELTKKQNNNNYKTLNSLTTDLSKNNYDPVIGREEEIQRLIEILCRRNKCNPILLGNAGVGKTALVEELSMRIKKNKVPKNLKNKRIKYLDMASAVAGTKYRGEFEDRIKKIIDEAESNDNVILFIDEIHTLVGAGGAEGAIDASNIFKPALARGKIKIIGATTYDEYKKSIEKDTALNRRFQKIIINEPDKDTLKKILMTLKTIYEKYHDVIISEELIDKLIILTDKFIYDRYEPDKSIDILDEVCTKVSLKPFSEEVKINDLEKELASVIKSKNNFITSNDYEKAYKFKDKEDIYINKINELNQVLLSKNSKKKVHINDLYKVISDKTNIPLYVIKNDYSKHINKIEKELKNNIVGQDESIEKLLDITKKMKIGINDKCYSLLICGPTGSGKTLLSNIYANSLVGKNNVIKIDMNEYQDSISINKLVGSSIPYSDNKCIFDEIRKKPYSILILDEIEKSSSNIINLFLSIMKDGKCTLSDGNVVRFDNVMIIMISNVNINQKCVGFNNVNSNDLNNYFSKDLLSKVDEIIKLKELNKNDISTIINKELSNYKNKYDLTNNLIMNVKKNVLEECMYENCDAKKIKNILKNNIGKELMYNNT